MSTGNPNPDSPIKPEQKKEIPSEWFYGMGDEKHGIMFVNFSPKFYNLGEQKVLEMTGFTMEEFNAEREKLEKQYKGKKEALEVPFKFKLSEGWNQLI